MIKYSWVFVAAVLAGCGGDSTAPVTKPLTVARVEITGPATALVAGTTLQLAATARTSDNVAVAGKTVSWSSSDANIASVDARGLVTGRNAGTATVQATADGVSGALALTVTAAPVSAVIFRQDTATLTTGESRVLVATARDAGGNDLLGRVATFTSSDTSVATVRSTGSVTAVAPGTATVTADIEGKRATATVTVMRGALPKLALQELASGVAGRYLTAPVGDTRQFLVTNEGRVWIIQNDKILPDPFLDIRDRVNQAINGLYSIAFHPQFATNGVFFVDYVDKNQDNRIERYTMTSDPNRANAASAQLVITVPHPPPFDHYGGWLGFGPDGKLYISTGDGGPGNSENAQNRNLLLGKLLRLDVNGAAPYTIPADNPFVGVANVRPEIWAFGLRNPFRDSFDRVTGTLYVADVGQEDWEEVNVVSPTRAGADYGWNRLEGTHCSSLSTTGCSPTGTVLPLLEYPHPGRPGAATSTHPAGCSVTGGYVYRGNRIPSLRGHYFYGDYCAGFVRSFRVDKGAVVDQQQWFDNAGSVLSFGEDGQGELYLITDQGKVYRIVQSS